MQCPLEKSLPIFVSILQNLSKGQKACSLYKMGSFTSVCTAAKKIQEGIKVASKHEESNKYSPQEQFLDLRVLNHFWSPRRTSLVLSHS